MRVLLTGFGPFSGFPTNPSQVIVDDFQMEEVVLEKKIFDVNRTAIEQGYLPLLDKFQPDFILNMGLNASSSVLNLETFAINSLKDGGFNDDWGKEAGLKTSIDTIALAGELCSNNIPALRSDHAGNYYCNFIFYHSLYWCKQNKRKGNALFLHIPFTTELASRYCHEMKKDFPSIEKHKIEQAVELIIRNAESPEV